MPAINSIKHFVKDGFYHLYNRGVEKRIIFMDEQDYAVFLSYLKYYLSPPDPPGHLAKNHPRRYGTGLIPVLKARPLHNIYKEVSLICYCLMPNHFHLMVKQKSPRAISLLMKGLGTTYSMYFNRKYKRVGSLFQGIYKASLVDSEEYLLHLSRYIHLNPVSDSGPKRYRVDPCTNAKEYPYSSYRYFLGWAKADWIYPHHVLDYFPKSPLAKKVSGYFDFVESAFESVISQDINLDKLVLEK